MMVCVWVISSMASSIALMVFLDKCMNLGSSLLRDVLGPASCAYYKPILLVL